MTTSTDSGTVTVRLTIPARAEYITLCRLALTGIGRLRELSDELLADLKLALTEAASNSVRHAYGATRDVGVVEISYELHSDRLVIEVTDEGEGFDPAAAEGHSDELSEGDLDHTVRSRTRSRSAFSPAAKGRACVSRKP
jgi:serine/threonine-protein kinase RsbW